MPDTKWWQKHTWALARWAKKKIFPKLLNFTFNLTNIFNIVIKLSPMYLLCSCNILNREPPLTYCVTMANCWKRNILYYIHTILTDKFIQQYIHVYLVLPFCVFFNLCRFFIVCFYLYSYQKSNYQG